MTRLLYWNLDGLTLDTVADPLDPAQSASRRQLIRTIFAQAGADIIVVGGVSTAAAAPGQLANGAGYSACRVLLQLLQGADPTGDWRLVPPLVVGTGNLAEGVAVYYRGAILSGNPAAQSGERIFTGPRRWGTTIPGSSLPRGSASIAGTYPAPQAADFGTARAIPAGAQYNAPSGGTAPQENRLAAGIDYYVAPFSTAPPGPVPLVFTPLPQPYFCSFCETNMAGAVQRNLSVIAVHANAAAPLATLNALGVSDEAASPLGANETRVVLGDFNTNLLNPDGSRNGAAYAPFAKYTAALDMPVAAPAPAHLQAYMSYAATRLRDPGSEGQSANFFFSNGSAIVEYPGFGYFGSESAPALFSTDNILVWQASPPTGGYPVTIANVCVGTPYQDPFGFNPKQGKPVVPLGAIPFSRQLLNPLPGSGPAADFPWSGSGAAPQLDPAANAILMSSANYGLVRSISGHFPVVADV